MIVGQSCAYNVQHADALLPALRSSNMEVSLTEKLQETAHITFILWPTVHYVRCKDELRLLQESIPSSH